MPKKTGWGFEEGDEIQPHLFAIKRLGGGKSYEVYLAWDDRLFALVAAKMLRPDQVTKPSALRQLTREAGVLERLSHPVVVRLFQAVTEGSRPHLVLEHLEGPTLGSLLKRYGPLTLPQLLPLALNVSAVLHYLRQEEIVHLDIKPGNIVMGAPPRLIDFSIARTLESAARLTQPLGTDPYMAPEQCSPGKGEQVGFGADMWGLGATLYHAIAGHPPFPPGDATAAGVERFPQLGSDPGPLPRKVPDHLSQSVLRCLTKNPSERPTPSEFALELQPAVEALPIRPVLGRRRPKIR